MIYIKSLYSNLNGTTSTNYLQFFSLRTFISWLQANTWNIENEKLKFQQITKETYEVNTQIFETDLSTEPTFQ